MINGSDQIPGEYLEADNPAVSSRHFFLFRTLWYDSMKPELGIAFAGLYSEIAPPDGMSFPIRLDRMFVYFQLWGDVNDYRLWIRLVEISMDEFGAVSVVQLGRDGSPREFRPPTNRPFAISGVNFVEEFAFPIGPVPFRYAGLYEFQLWVDGVEEPIGTERILAREYRYDE